MTQITLDEKSLQNLAQGLGYAAQFVEPNILLVQAPYGTIAIRNLHAVIACDLGSVQVRIKHIEVVDQSVRVECSFHNLDTTEELIHVDVR